MSNEILEAVARQLNSLFGDDYAIYTETVNQGFVKPCFFVQLIEQSEKPMINNRFYRKTGVCIQFLQGEAVQPSDERNRVAEGLMNEMEYVRLTDESLLRGTGKSWKMENGILNFFISYSAFFNKLKQTEEPMETIEIEKGLVK